MTLLWLYKALLQCQTPLVKHAFTLPPVSFFKFACLSARPSAMFVALLIVETLHFIVCLAALVHQGACGTALAVSSFCCHLACSLLTVVVGFCDLLAWLGTLWGAFAFVDFMQVRGALPTVVFAGSVFAPRLAQ